MSVSIIVTNIYFRSLKILLKLNFSQYFKSTTKNTNYGAHSEKYFLIFNRSWNYKFGLNV